MLTIDDLTDLERRMVEEIRKNPPPTSWSGPWPYEPAFEAGILRLHPEFTLRKEGFAWGEVARLQDRVDTAFDREVSQERIATIVRLGLEPWEQQFMAQYEDDRARAAELFAQTYSWGVTVEASYLHLPHHAGMGRRGRVA